MRRREFITLLASTAVVWSFAAHGQSPKPVIGFLRNTTPDESADLLTALRKGLNEAGYVEGENLAIEYRWGGGHQDQLHGLADDLIRHKVSLIIGGGDAAIIATNRDRDAPNRVRNRRRPTQTRICGSAEPAGRYCHGRDFPV